MLFRPPDVTFYHLDRIALLALVFVVMLRAVSRNQTPRLTKLVALPLFGLMTLSAWDVLRQPYQADRWAALVTRWIVPFALFHLSQLIFQDTESHQQFERFLLVVLVYLSAIAVAFLFGWTALIFPKFILDESIGIHADRARGPFLQAVANGVTLNLLGLVALNAFRRGKLRGIAGAAVLAALPIAILATKTRAVWLSFAISLLAVFFVSTSWRLRKACVSMAVASVVVVLIAASLSGARTDLGDRFTEQSPVEFRASLYEAGWQMFLEKPLIGWNAGDVQDEIAKRVTDFHSDGFAFHNSYLDVAVASGGLGLLLYLWLYIDLVRLGKCANRDGSSFVDSGFRQLWPILIGVYALNACFVLMQYQFVNAVLFSVAGMLAAQNQRFARPDWSLQ
jgi:putative inorganic carbon (HCO3(-)) transporter